MTMPDTTRVRGLGRFEQRLDLIVSTSDSEEEEQSGLLLELIREVHAVKWILLWVLVIVPLVLIGLSVVTVASRS
jgi:hypothetical protein